MLQNWLKPLSASFIKSTDSLSATHFGKNILVFRDQLPDLKKVKVALVGVGEKEANVVRENLYRTACPFPKGTVADLGNLRKAEASLLIPVLNELLLGKVLPIVISSKDEMARAQFFAYQDAKALVNMAVVDERFRLGSKDEAYTPLLSPVHPLLFNFGLVGFQAHQTPPELSQFLTQNNFDAVRLGKSRAAIEETEPVLRDADLLAFHLGALKQSEAPGVTSASPSGYFAEEACQLCRYAGMSDKLTSFGIYGYRPELDRDAQTAQVAAQMVWYFLEGFFGRKNDFPASKTGLTEYIVAFRQLNYQLTFWKSSKSGRWWMQVPVASKKKLERHRLVPCSYQDYQQACREDLPERLMQALQRFG
ncbi:MAG: arginase family protein [Saprospiraceae bacterium]|nr:arginase family protein [Saprospiraceae bacterium]